mmetsp:Transcript_99103/g.284968  ORF Transcript_99103/g.284968 Transcript_99103/m.284968 type:complete len:209 (-) Transcript_99103:8-634(-)
MASEQEERAGVAERQTDEHIRGLLAHRRRFPERGALQIQAKDEGEVTLPCGVAVGFRHAAVSKRLHRRDRRGLRLGPLARGPRGQVWMHAVAGVGPVPAPGINGNHVLSRDARFAEGADRARTVALSRTAAVASTHDAAEASSLLARLGGVQPLMQASPAEQVATSRHHRLGCRLQADVTLEHGCQLASRHGPRKTLSPPEYYEPERP